MSKFDELFEKLKASEAIQENGEWEENIPEEIWDEYFMSNNKNYKEVAYGLHVSTHRWYETSVTVIEIEGELLGIQHITNMYSEESMYEDCYHTVTYHRMEAIKRITYEIISE